MDNTEKELRSAIAENIGILVEKILTKKRPYDVLPLQKEAALSLCKIEEYNDEIDENLKTNFIKYLIVSGRFFCSQNIIGSHGKPFSEQYPELEEYCNDFWNWIKSKEGYDLPDYDDEPIKKSSVNNCVKQTIKKRYPDFKIDNKPFGSIGYSKQIGLNTKLFIIADTGSWRSTISFLIGVDNPHFCLDVSDFFDGGQSHYSNGFGSIDVIEKGTNKALDLVGALLPHFEECVKKAFKQCGRQV